MINIATSLLVNEIRKEENDAQHQARLREDSRTSNSSGNTSISNRSINDSYN